MSATWYGDADPPQPQDISPRGWLRASLRMAALAVLLSAGMFVLLILRLFERPLFGMARPVTPHIAVFVCTCALWVIGLRVERHGDIARAARAVVTNHASWLDIFVLNAIRPVCFVSKADVARWPGIGWLARATGTVFIDRTRTRSAEQAALFRDRLLAGHRLVFFPEGTSSDGQRVLPFKSTLFAAFLAEDLAPDSLIQPLSIRYEAPAGADPRFYGWWGDMDFGPHALMVLAAGRQGRVQVECHEPLPVRDFADRKSLAAAAEVAVRAGYEALARA